MVWPAAHRALFHPPTSRFINPPTAAPTAAAARGSRSGFDRPAEPRALPQSEKALQYAEEQVLAKGEPDPKELQRVYEKFLKIENHRIRLKHYAGKSGREICSHRAGLVDLIVRHLVAHMCAGGKIDLAE